MKTKKRQKLCYNCEGDVDLDVIVCPFCAADLREEQQKAFSPAVQSVKQLHTEQSLYPPHYAPHPPQQEEEALPQASPMGEEEAPPSKSALLAILLFTLGVQLLLLALMMVFCSHQGILILTWNAHTWFLYFFASFPLLYFGYRALTKL
jgi:hypothetical protein